MQGVDTWKAIIAAWLSALSVILLEYLLKFRPGLAREYMAKTDCQRISDQLHRENREDHLEIFKRLDELRGLILGSKK